MELSDLKCRLKFDDVVLNSRCVVKLVEVIKKKRLKGEIISASSVQVPELNLLWETCSDESNATSNLAIKAVISLVTNRHMELSYAMNKILSSITSARNLQALVNGLTSLLIFEAEQNSNSSKSSNYSLEFPKHPLISVLQSREDSWPLVIDNVFEVINSVENHRFHAMEPVICYILSNPHSYEGKDFWKIFVLEKFAEFGKRQLTNAGYLFQFIPLLQVKTFNQVVEVSHFIRRMNKVLNEFENDNQNEDFSVFYENLLLVSLSLCASSMDCGYDPGTLLRMAVDIADSLPKQKSLSLCSNTSLMMVSLLIKVSSGVNVEKLLAIGNTLLERGQASPTVSAICLVSVIQLISEPSVLSSNCTDSSSFALSKFLDVLVSQSTNFNNLCEISNQTNLNYIETFTPLLLMSLECVKFSLQLDVSNVVFKMEWLNSMKTLIEYSESDLSIIFSLVATLFLQYSDDFTFLSTCLEAMQAVVDNNRNLSTKMFALLLYKQSHVNNPEAKLIILEYLAKSATHKYAVPPVVSIFQMMANHVELKSQAIYLMLQLWKKQDRCFSYLHTHLLQRSKLISSDTGVNEILISQAEAIKEICISEPEKYGKEFLGVLSSIFNESQDEANSSVACLALDGVIALCKSEVIDMRSTWRALAPRLSKDKRTLVICRMYQLLDLVPELQVKSSEYDKFMTEILTYVWRQISVGTSSPVCVSAAYKTLAHFPIDYFTLKQLPAAAKENLKLPVSMTATPFEMSKLPEDVLSYIPGYCFIDLLKSISDDTIMEGYTVFLQSLIRYEIMDLPRSVYSQRKHLVKRQNVSDVLSQIPAFLCSQFEMRKSPALQKNLAVGVLLSYEPPVEMGKDGQPIKRSIAAQSRFYEEVLGVLLSEVNMDTSDWQRCILLPSAWGSFMERAFFACEEARRAELEMQCTHGHIASEELGVQIKSAWLWVRERLLNLIKTKGKNSPTSHANSVFAMAGLVHSLNKFHASLEESVKALCEDSENFVSHNVFQAQCTETLLCAMAPDYKPSAKVFSWLLTHLSRVNSSASYLVRGCSSASLYLLTPVLTGSFVDTIHAMCQILLQNLSHSSPVLVFYSGFGLGLFIKSLCQEGYVESGSSQENLALNIVKKMFSIYNDEEPSRSGCLIGLTVAIAAMSQSGNEEFKDCVKVTCDSFHEKLMEENPSSMSFEMLGICVSAMMISAASGSCVPIQSVEKLASWFDEKQSDSPQCSGASVSAGILIDALDRLGISQNSELKQKLQKEWYNTLTSEKKPTLHRLAALNGLCALYSAGRGLLMIKDLTTTGNTASALNDLIPFMFQMLNAAKDNGLRNICSWEIGRLFSIHSCQQQVETSVADNYSYLNEKSILKPLMNLIIKNSESATKQHRLCCLKAIGIPFPRPLPPLNWVSALTPLLQMNEDPEFIEIALSICIHQLSSSTTAVALMSSYCNPPLIQTLPANCFALLLNHISELVGALPTAKLLLFLRTIISSTIRETKDLKESGLLTIQGIMKSLGLPNSKQRSMKILQEAFGSIFKHFRNNPDKFKEHLPLLLDGLSSLPEESINGLILISENDENVPALMSVWCHLVKTGKKPLSCLRQCIEASKYISKNDKEQVLTSVYNCFLTGSITEESDTNKPEKCIAWLLETIGWIRVLTDTKSKYQLMTIGEVFVFLVDICLATIVGCSGLEVSYSYWPLPCVSHNMLLQKLPSSIYKLISKDKWCDATDKIIDWLLLLQSSSHLEDHEKYHVKACLCSIRDSKEFLKMPIWTEVVCSIKNNTV